MSAPFELTIRMFPLDKRPEAARPRFEDQSYSLSLEPFGQAVVDVPWRRWLPTLRRMERATAEPAELAELGAELRGLLVGAGWALAEKELEGSEAGARVTVCCRAAELYRLPWELLRLSQANQALVDRPGVTLRYEWPPTGEDGRRPAAIAPEGPPSVLVAWSGGDVPGARLLAVVREAAASAPTPLEVCGCEGPSLDALIAEVERLRPAVLHLLCHGRPDADGQMCLALGALGDELAHPDQLRRAFASLAPSLPLVVLMACRTASVGPAGQLLGSPSLALHQAGVAAALAARSMLDKGDAIALSENFYASLLSRLGSVEQATAAARRAVGVRSASGSDGHVDAAAFSLQLWGRRSAGWDTRPLRICPFERVWRVPGFRADVLTERSTGLVAEVKGLLEAAGAVALSVPADGSWEGGVHLALQGPLSGLGRVTTLLPTRDTEAELRRVEERLKGHQERRHVLILETVEALLEWATPRQREGVERALLRALDGGWTGPAPGLGESGPPLEVKLVLIGHDAVVERLEEAGLSRLAKRCPPTHRVTRGPLLEPQLRELARQSAARLGQDLDPGLAHAVAARVVGAPRSVDLMMRVLAAVWRAHGAGGLTELMLDRLGGVDGVVWRAPARVLRNMSEPERRLALHLMVRLVDIGDAPSEDGLRRGVPVRELRPHDGERFDAVVDALSGPDGVLLRGRDELGQPTLSLAHPAPLTRWPLLREQLEGVETRGRWIRVLELERACHRAAREDRWLDRAQLPGLLEAAEGLQPWLLPSAMWVLRHSEEQSRASLEGLGLSAAERRVVEAMRRAERGQRRPWDLLVPEGEVGDRLLRLAEPLVALRQHQASRPVRALRFPLGLPLGEQMAWLDDSFPRTPGLDTPLPFVTLLGGPEHVPFIAQQQLAERAAVGRLDFFEGDDWERYADKVRRSMEAERVGPSPLCVSADPERSRAVGMVLGLWGEPTRERLERLGLSLVVQRFQDIHAMAAFLGEGQGQAVLAIHHGAIPGKRRFEEGLAALGMPTMGRGPLPSAALREAPWVPLGLWVHFGEAAAGSALWSSSPVALQELMELGHYRHVPRLEMREGGRLVEYSPRVSTAAKLALANPRGPLGLLGCAMIKVILPDQRVDALADVLLAAHRGAPLGELPALLGRSAHEVDTRSRSLAQQLEGRELAIQQALLRILQESLQSWVLIGDPAARLPL
ncbi:MAG: CHAT domain-containing protein [Alphaproteobacteria bacterium]|nr:CHAT domain-containing protein [Alphaproteobacteria bacterium]